MELDSGLQGGNLFRQPVKSDSLKGHRGSIITKTSLPNCIIPFHFALLFILSALAFLLTASQSFPNSESRPELR